METKELFEKIEETVTAYIDQITAFDNEAINKIPFEGSWSIGQLFEHVTKSNKGVATVMLKPFPLTQRGPEEFVEKLRSIFLSEENRFDAPDFIVPGNGPYDKEKIIAELESSFTQFIKNATEANLNEQTEGMPFGPITKLEVIHFVLYHSQRHLRQLQKMCAAL